MANRRFIDFPIAASVGDNDIVLIWQDGLNKQTTKATLLQGSPSSLAGLTDVDIASLTNGQILQYNSTTSKWENVDRTDINLSELGDVTIVAPANGQVLVYNSSTSKWENSSAGYVPYTGAVTTVNLGAQSILAGSFVKAGGTSAQFLKADGSVDSSTYGTGTVTSVALTMPTAFSVANSPITTAGTLAVTATGTTSQYIRGDGSLETFPALTGFVPYTGATADVNLGTHDLLAERGTFANNGSSDTLTVNHTSGSGYGIIVTKGGNNEALYVSKTSGSGNAMTVVGGRTSLVDLALSSVTNTAGDFLTLSGGVVHKRTAAQTLTDIGGQAALTNPVTGTGTSGQVAYFTGTSAISSESNLFWDATNDRLGIGTATPSSILHIVDTSANATTLIIGETGEIPTIKAGGANTDLRIEAVGYGGFLELVTDSNPRIRINPGGNVLIGTVIDNSNKLRVNGKIWADDIITSTSFVKDGGTSTQFLKADGSVDSSTYLTTGTAASTYLPLAGGTLTGALNGTSGAFTGAVSGSAVTITATTGIAGDFTNNSSTNETLRARNNGSGNIAAFRNASAEVASITNSGGLTLSGALNGTSASFSAGVNLATSTSAVQIGPPQSGSTFKLLTLSSNGNDLDTGTVLRLIGNSALDLVDISVKDTITRIFHQENSADALDGYGKIQFRTNATANASFPTRGGFQFTINNTDALTIASTGSVGIGTVTPSSILHIVDTSANDTTLTIGVAGEVPTIKAGGANTDLKIEAVGSGGFLQLVTNSNPRLTITAGGNLLVGTTTNGASKLRIVGLPTSSAGLSSGDVYNLAGVLMIA
jgi:hypothetical protein